MQSTGLLSLPKPLLALWAVFSLHQATALGLPRSCHNAAADTVPSLNVSTSSSNVFSLFRRDASIAISDLDDFCDDDPYYMGMTPANLEEARPGQFYRDFINFMKTNHTEEYKEKIGPTLFAKYS